MTKFLYGMWCKMKILIRTIILLTLVTHSFATNKLIFAVDIVRHGDKIAQLVISQVFRELAYMPEDLKERGEGGFGSTGK